MPNGEFSLPLRLSYQHGGHRQFYYFLMREGGRQLPPFLY
nr:MAG TPA: hypothetical protein [Caudoviricetes sp.]